MNLALFTRAIYGLHGYGGMERHCRDWIDTMVQQGCKVHVVTMPPSFLESLHDFPAEVSFYFVPGLQARSVFRRITSYPQWVKRAGKLLHQMEKDVPLDAVYANGLAAAGCNHLRTPVFYNPHGMEEFKCSGLKYLAYSRFRTLSREAAEMAAKVIATDRSMIPELTEFLDVPESKIALLPNAVSRTDLWKTEPFAASGDPILVAVGRLEPNKGFHILIEAFAECKTIPESTRLYIVGDGSMAAELHRLSQQHGVAEKIIFSGKLSEGKLHSLYSQASLFVNPTIYEGSSIVTLEAMSHKLPVVATRTGGLPDKIIPGHNGWLTSPGYARSLAETLTIAFQKRDQWKQMGDNSKTLVDQNFSWGKIGPEFLKLLNFTAETQR